MTQIITMISSQSVGSQLSVDVDIDSVEGSALSNAGTAGSDEKSAGGLASDVTFSPKKPATSSSLMSGSDSSMGSETFGGKIVCKYDYKCVFFFLLLSLTLSCYRANLQHLATYAHPRRDMKRAYLVCLEDALKKFTMYFLASHSFLSSSFSEFRRN